MSLGHILIVLLVFWLASARLTRVVNADTIAEPLRARIAVAAERAKAASDEATAAGETVRAVTYQKRAIRWVGAYDLAICPWCISWWVALPGAVGAVWIIKYNWQLDWWAIVPLALAASHLIGMFARFVQGD